MKTGMITLKTKRIKMKSLNYNKAKVMIFKKAKLKKVKLKFNNLKK